MRVKGRARTRALRFGEGSVYVRPTTSGEVRYQARWVDHAGNARAKTFAAKDAAVEFVREQAVLRRSVQYMADTDMTVRDVVNDYIRRGETRWSPSTVASYRGVAGLHIFPELGHHLASEMTPRNAQVFLDKVALKHSPARVSVIRAVLSGAFKEAVRLGVITTNPISGVRLPKIVKRDYTIWTVPQAAKILAVTADDLQMHAYYATALSTGMRPGEIRALSWKDVDFGARMIRVARTITRDGNDRIVIGTTTKTGKTRMIPMTDHLASILQQVKEDQQTRRLHTSPWHHGNLVFDRGDGDYVPQQTIRIKHHRYCVAAQVPECRLHDLRHAAATYMIRAGTNVKVVGDILGHANVTTTMEIYQHVNDQERRQAVDTLSGMLNDSRRKELA